MQALFTDVDGTLTTNGVLESRTLASLEALRAAGVRVVLVSGRPSGFGECWMRTLPVDGAILENGGLWFVREAGGRVRKTYVQTESTRIGSRRRLMRETRAVLKRIPGARLSTDSRFTEVDIAVDYNEEIHLGTEAAERIEALFHARGVNAVRSSVHVNAWIGRFDKAVAVRRFLRREWKASLEEGDDRWVYLGDSFNDAPLFRAFPLSIGVANVRDSLPGIDAPPRFVTRGREGAGVREVVRRILATRGGHGS